MIKGGYGCACVGSVINQRDALNMRKCHGNVDRERNHLNAIVHVKVKMILIGEKITLKSTDG